MPQRFFKLPKDFPPPPPLLVLVISGQMTKNRIFAKTKALLHQNTLLNILRNIIYAFISPKCILFEKIQGKNYFLSHKTL